MKAGKYLPFKIIALKAPLRAIYKKGPPLLANPLLHLSDMGFYFFSDGPHLRHSVLYGTPSGAIVPR